MSWSSSLAGDSADFLRPKEGGQTINPNVRPAEVIAKPDYEAMHRVVSKPAEREKASDKSSHGKSF